MNSDSAETPGRPGSRSRAITVCMILSVALLVPGCGDDRARQEGAGSTSEGAPSAPAALRILTAAEPAGMNPLVGKRRGTMDLWRQVYPTLLRLEPGSPITPVYDGDLAGSWRWEDGSLLCVIRKDRLWEDSVRIGIQDVVRTYEAYRLMGWMPQSAPPDSLEDPGLVRVSAVDDSTVRLLFRPGFPWWAALDAATWPLLPAHRLGTLDRTLLESSPLARSPVSGGSFRLKDWLAGMPMVLTPNPNAPSACRPRVSQVVVEACPGLDTRVLRLAAGRADLVLDVPIHGLRLLLQGSPRVRAHRAGPAAVEMILWNLNHPRTPRDLREAVSLAVDRDLMVRELLTWRGGVYGSPAAGVLESAGPAAGALEPEGPAAAPAGLQDSEGPAAAPADLQDSEGPAAAPANLRDSLLAHAPLPRYLPSAARSLVENLDHPRVEFLYESGYQLRERLAAMVEADLSRVGIETEPIPLESAEFWSRFMAGEFQAVLIGFRIPPVPDLSDLWGPNGAWNRGGYRSAALDSLLERQRTAATPGELARWSRWIEAQVRRDGPAVFLVARERLDLCSPRVQGFGGTVWNPLGDLHQVHLER